MMPTIFRDSISCATYVATFHVVWPKLDAGQSSDGLQCTFPVSSCFHSCGYSLYLTVPVVTLSVDRGDRVPAAGRPLRHQPWPPAGSGAAARRRQRQIRRRPDPRRAGDGRKLPVRAFWAPRGAGNAVLTRASFAFVSPRFPFVFPSFAFVSLRFPFVFLRFTSSPLRFTLFRLSCPSCSLHFPFNLLCFPSFSFDFLRSPSSFLHFAFVFLSFSFRFPSLPRRSCVIVSAHSRDDTYFMKRRRKMQL